MRLWGIIPKHQTNIYNGESSMKITTAFFTAGIITVLFFSQGSCSYSSEDPLGDYAGMRTISFDQEAHGDSSSSAITLNDTSTMSDYLAYAALHNPGLEAAFNRWKASVERIPQAKALPDPRFSYSYYIDAVETRVGPQRHRFDLSQMFPWFGTRRLRGDIAEQEANALWASFESMKRNLFYTVKRSFYEYYYLSRALELTEENLDFLESVEKVARTGYTSGKIPYQDVIRSQLEIGKLEERLLSIKDLMIPVKAELNTALNRPSGEPLPVSSSIPGDEGIIAEDELIKQLSHNNPELKALDFQVKKEAKLLDLAHKQFYPDITLGINYIETGPALMSGTPDSGKDPVMGMFTISLPLWREKYRASVHEAQARQKSAVKTRNDRENSLIADLERALFNYRESQRKIDLYKNTLIPKARESLEVSMQAFKAGETDYLNLIDAQRTILEFELSYERALSDRALSFAHIELLAGTDSIDKNK